MPNEHRIYRFSDYQNQLKDANYSLTTDTKFTARTPFERDRDRVLYSSAFRRLARVTQVVHAQEGDIYHNRLTHTLEVAQIGRRLSQYLLRYGKDKEGLQDQLDPDVVEAACLIHDLGHPPFGHIAEYKLNELVVDHGDSDGYEGNAQSFRIVTRLINYNSNLGLDLTRATLNAVLKYPWFRSRDTHSKRHRKFNAYENDKEIFKFARADYPEGILSLEAQVMDLADGIAYAVHDLNDFIKAGVIDLSFLSTQHKFDAFFDEHFSGNEKILPHREYIQNIWDSVPTAPFSGSRQDEIAQATMSSDLISRLLDDSVKLKQMEGLFHLDPDPRVDAVVEFLKSILWNRVIMRPSLALQQAGQERVIKMVFEFYIDSFGKRDRITDIFQFPKGLSSTASNLKLRV